MIATIVDGAQSFGVLDVDLADLAPDFYTGSGHKWPCGPREVGVLLGETRTGARAKRHQPVCGCRRCIENARSDAASATSRLSRLSAPRSRFGPRSAPPPSNATRASSLRHSSPD